MNIISYFKEADITLDKGAFSKFEKFLEIFKEKNVQLNLSAIRKDKDIIIKHFIDSLLPIHFFDFEEHKTLIDIGAGGGFPSIPLAIYFPSLEVTINDSIEKKLKAVSEFAQKLDLKNVQTLPGRIEDFGNDEKWREHFDIATLRAVALMPTALEYAAPMVKENGYIVLYKGNTYKEELHQSKNAIEKLNLTLESVHVTELPENQGERAILIFTKETRTSDDYPRAVGEAKKNPL